MISVASATRIMGVRKCTTSSYSGTGSKRCHTNPAELSTTQPVSRTRIHLRGTPTPSPALYYLSGHTARTHAFRSRCAIVPQVSREWAGSRLQTPPCTGPRFCTSPPRRGNIVSAPLPVPRGERTKVPPHVFLILATLFWAGNFVYGRELAAALPAVGINLIRWLLACAVLVPLSLFLEGPAALKPLKANPRLWAMLGVMAASGVVAFNSLVYLALTETTSTNAALINATTPILTLFMAALIGGAVGTGGGELTLRRLAGALLGVAGVAWIVSRGSLAALAELSLNRGDALMLVAALAWALYTVVSGGVARQMSPLSAVTVSALMALPVLAVIGGPGLAGSGAAFTPLVVLGLIYVGLFASVAAYLSWNTGIGKLGASRGSIFLNLVPVFTALLAFVVLNERLAPAQIAGGALVLLGVTLVNTGKR